ncbi:MAG: radical SAM protein, partial [Gemmatimonadota bacterium]|nr:radical SAM protein [Gemmatimonadota bacterium]
MSEIPDIVVPELERSSPGLAPHPDPESFPTLEPGHLDALWFQVTGTVCNLECTHCFISCSPVNRTFEYLSVDDVARRLEESVALGVREYYFTGGEPFIHPEIVEILALSLEYGPTTVLTNGTVLKPSQLGPLAEAAVASPYSLEFRVSIDGFDAATHDAIRGEGSFERAIEGVQRLLAHGFLPIVTAVRTWPEGEEPEVYRGFVRMLQRRGDPHPRVKLMPALKIGAEAERDRGYRRSERVTRAMVADEEFDLSQLVCASARVVTDRGIWVCPILLE